MGVANINSNLATGIRTIFILVLVWCIIFIRGEAKGLNQLSGRGLLFLALSAVATGLSWLFYFKALWIGNVSEMSILDKLSIVLTILLAALFLGKAITWRTALDTPFIVAGSLLFIKP